MRLGVGSANCPPVPVAEVKRTAGLRLQGSAQGLPAARALCFGLAQGRPSRMRSGWRTSPYSVEWHERPEARRDALLPCSTCKQ